MAANESNMSVRTGTMKLIGALRDFCECAQKSCPCQQIIQSVANHITEGPNPNERYFSENISSVCDLCTLKLYR